jgi:RimJ/RimL family protein N-acetyltransferase
MAMIVKEDPVDDVRLQPFDPERDAALVSTWVFAPHVSRWWGDPAKALAEVLERPAGGGDALIVADGVPVGYIRWQKLARAELDGSGLSEVCEQTTMDIDIAIGEPEYLGRGVGSRAIGLLVKELDGESGLRTIMITTSIDNVAALRAYEKAGFERRRRFDDADDGEYWLLTREAQPCGAEQETGY